MTHKCDAGQCSLDDVLITIVTYTSWKSTIKEEFVRKEDTLQALTLTIQGQGNLSGMNVYKNRSV